MTGERFDELGKPAFAIAYRMLGSVSEAEDVVQEGLLRLHQARDPPRKAEMADSLSLAFLVLLESLSPEQRAAFLLREVFDEPYDRIAEIVGTTEQNARRLAARARRHVAERRPRFESSRAQREQLATRFFAAAEEGDLGGLEELLAHDVVLRGDRGGKAPALVRGLDGRARVARTLIGGLCTAGRRICGVTWRR